MKYKNKSYGSVYLAVLIILSLLLTFGMTFTFMVSSGRKQGILNRDRMVASYLADAGVKKMLLKISELADEPLIKEDDTVNEKKLDLLSKDRADDFNIEITLTNLYKNSTVKVIATIQNIRETPFNCGIDTDKELPQELKPFKINSKTRKSSEKLGGWEGELRILSEAKYNGRKYNLEVIRGIKVMDLSPCAPLYTLFIQGKGKEILKAGKFKLSNWQFSGGLYKKFSKLLTQLTSQTGSLLDKTSGLDLLQMVQIIKSFVMVNNDLPQRQAAEELIMSLSPWGYIRTNGELDVYLPFFAVDDIIHYFVLNPYFQRPEVGYPGSNSRLHDVYMAKYTRYEGNVKKFYYRLAPYILERQYPRKINDKYTRYSTYTYYPLQHTDRLYAENYKRYEEYARKYSSTIITKDTSLYGSKDSPIILNGLTYISGNLNLEGIVKGKGLLFVKNGNVKLTGDVKYADKKSKLVLFVSDGYVYMDQGKKIDFNGSIFSNQSIKGGKKININGNLVVNKLNHQEGEQASFTIMPKEVDINYDPDIRNIMADNLVICVSRSDILRRKL